MPKSSKHFSTPTPENPEWTAEKFARSRRATDIPELQGLIKRGRGPQREPTKKLISIRLSEDVLQALRATGSGWQSRADEALRSWINQQPKSTS